MAKRIATLRKDQRVESIEPTDGSVDEEYVWDLFLADGWQISGYGGRTKFCRNLQEVQQFVETAERGDRR